MSIAQVSYPQLVTCPHCNEPVKITVVVHASCPPTKTKPVEKRWTDAILEEAARLRGEGWTLRKLGERYGVQPERMSRVLRRHQFKQEAEALAERRRVTGEGPTLIDHLVLSVRTYEALRRTGIATIADLLQKSARDLLLVKNFGRKSLKELRIELGRHRLELRDDYVD